MYIPVYSFLFHQIYNLPIILEINKNNLLTVPNFIDLYTRENKISEHRGIVNKEASVKRENRYFFFPIPINRWSRGGKKYFRHWRGTWKRSVRNIGWRKDRSDKLWNGGEKKKKSKCPIHCSWTTAVNRLVFRAEFFYYFRMRIRVGEGTCK